MNYYNKYIKYKYKYSLLKQIGGNLDEVKDILDQIFSASRVKVSNPINAIINKSYKSGNFFLFCSKYLNNNNESIIKFIKTDSLRKKIMEKDTSINIDDIRDNKDYVIIVNEKNNKLNMYDFNLFITTFSHTDDNYYINKVSCYVKNIIQNHNSGKFNKSIIYLAIAVYNQDGFYVPEFIREQLNLNSELTYTIIIVANEYVDKVMWDYDITKNKVIEEFKKKNPVLSERILFIHMMMTIPNSIKNVEANFINNIKNNTQNNYCYIGYESCGRLFYRVSHFYDPSKYNDSQYDKNKNIDNVIFVGCDGIFIGEKKIQKTDLANSVDNSLILSLLS